MKRRNLMSARWTIRALAMAACAGILTAALCAAAADAQAEKKAATANGASTPTSIATGSGKQYKTTVDRKTEGELTAEDFRQASLLTARVVLHLNKAGVYLADDKKDQSRQELEKGLALVEVIHRLLPTTTVTTVVRDKDGKEVYRHVDQMQDDKIPLFEGLIAVNTMEPITDAKQGEAAVHGVKLTDAELLHTSVLVNLAYIESKLNHAMKLLKDKPEDALAQVTMAQSRGLEFMVNKQDDPLVKAQMALQVAERMSEEGREQAAKANLQLARNFLELYRGVLPAGKSEHVEKLQGEITKLEGEIGRKGAAATIRGFWDRVASWFVRKPGEMRATGSESAAKTTTKSDTAGTAGKDTTEQPKK